MSGIKAGQEVMFKVLVQCVKDDEACICPAEEDVDWRLNQTWIVPIASLTPTTGLLAQLEEQKRVIEELRGKWGGEGKHMETLDKLYLELSRISKAKPLIQTELEQAVRLLLEAGDFGLDRAFENQEQSWRDEQKKWQTAKAYALAILKH